MSSTGLYSDAITAVLPKGFLDASQFRQIPDTQEVYVSPENDDSLVIDLMEKVSETTPKDYLKTHLDEIVALNGSDPNSQVETVLTEEVTANVDKETVLTAYVTVAVEPANKWGRTASLENEDGNKDLMGEPLLVMIMGVLRLDKADTDVVVTYNVPITHYSEYQGVLTQTKEAMPERVQKGIEAVETLFKTFVVVNWKLFIV